MAQQASELIVKTIVPQEQIHRQSDGSTAKVLSSVARTGDGLYVIGFDYHVGFLIQRNGQALFCHSSYLGPATVVCSKPKDDSAFISNYHVFGPVLNDAIIIAWLTNKKIF